MSFSHSGRFAGSKPVTPKRSTSTPSSGTSSPSASNKKTSIGGALASHRVQGNPITAATTTTPSSTSVVNSEDAAIPLATSDPLQQLPIADVKSETAAEEVKIMQQPPIVQSAIRTVQLEGQRNNTPTLAPSRLVNPLTFPLQQSESKSLIPDAIISNSASLESATTVPIFSVSSSNLPAAPAAGYRSFLFRNRQPLFLASSSHLLAPSTPNQQQRSPSTPSQQQQTVEVEPSIRESAPFPRSSIKSMPSSSKSRDRSSVATSFRSSTIPVIARRFRDAPSAQITAQVLAAIFPTQQALQNAFPNGVPKNLGCFQDQEMFSKMEQEMNNVEPKDEEEDEDEEVEVEEDEEESQKNQAAQREYEDFMQHLSQQSSLNSSSMSKHRNSESKDIDRSTNSSNSSAGSPCFDDSSLNRRYSPSTSSSTVSPASFSPQLQPVEGNLQSPVAIPTNASMQIPAATVATTESFSPIDNADTLHLFPTQYSSMQHFGGTTTQVMNENDMLVSSDSKLLFRGGFNAIAVQRCHPHARTSLLKQHPLPHLPNIMVRLLRLLEVGEPVILMRHPFDCTPQILQCQCGEWACQYHLACRCADPHCIWPMMIHDGNLPHFHHAAPIEDSDSMYFNQQQ